MPHLSIERKSDLSKDIGGETGNTGEEGRASNASGASSGSGRRRNSGVASSRGRGDNGRSSVRGRRLLRRTSRARNLNGRVLD